MFFIYWVIFIQSYFLKSVSPFNDHPKYVTSVKLVWKLLFCIIFSFKFWFYRLRVNKNILVEKLLCIQYFTVIIRYVATGISRLGIETYRSFLRFENPVFGLEITKLHSQSVYSIFQCLILILHVCQLFL